MSKFFLAFLARVFSYSLEISDPQAKKFSFSGVNGCILLLFSSIFGWAKGLHYLRYCSISTTDKISTCVLIERASREDCFPSVNINLLQNSRFLGNCVFEIRGGPQDIFTDKKVHIDKAHPSVACRIDPDTFKL